MTVTVRLLTDGCKIEDESQSVSFRLMASIAPQLGQQYLNGLNNQYTGLANMGMGAASQGASQASASALGGNISALQQQAAQAAASNSLAQGNIWGNVTTDLAGLGYNYANS